MGSFRRRLLTEFRRVPSRSWAKPCLGEGGVEGATTLNVESRMLQWMPSLGNVIGSTASAWLLLVHGRCAPRRRRA